MSCLLKESILEFGQYLIQEEKSSATIEKYLRDIRAFYTYLNGRSISKEETILYKEKLTRQYAAASTNSMLVALNCFLRFLERPDCCVRLLKIQRQIFASEDRELTREDYKRLVHAAAGTRLALVIQTICGTGIRVSELRHITAEAVWAGKAVVRCKNKTRIIFIPVRLQQLLLNYIKKSGLTAGPVFISKKGNPLNRSNIWRDMKTLCEKAHVSAKKVYPHNLRHLFARTFYSVDKDIVRLADLLGHSSINTTRIYTMETGGQHLDRLDKVQTLLVT